MKDKFDFLTEHQKQQIVMYCAIHSPNDFLKAICNASAKADLEQKTSYDMLYNAVDSWIDEYREAHSKSESNEEVDTIFFLRLMEIISDIADLDESDWWKNI